MRVRRIPKYVFNELVALFSDDETECYAARGDVTYIVGGLACLCQRKNDFNNIVAFRIGGAGIANIRAMGLFVLILRLRYGIEYVRIDGKKGRYRVMSRIFPTVRIDPRVTGRDVRYLYVDDECVEILRGIAYGSCR